LNLLGRTPRTYVAPEVCGELSLRVIVPSIRRAVRLHPALIKKELGSGLALGKYQILLTGCSESPMLVCGSRGIIMQTGRKIHEAGERYETHELTLVRVGDVYDVVRSGGTGSEVLIPYSIRRSSKNIPGEKV
jgi:hypothetical protein